MKLAGTIWAVVTRSASMRRSASVASHLRHDDHRPALAERHLGVGGRGHVVAGPAHEMDVVRTAAPRRRRRDWAAPPGPAGGGPGDALGPAGGARGVAHGRHRRAQVLVVGRLGRPRRPGPTRPRVGSRHRPRWTPAGGGGRRHGRSVVDEDAGPGVARRCRPPRGRSAGWRRARPGRRAGPPPYQAAKASGQLPSITATRSPGPTPAWAARAWAMALAARSSRPKVMRRRRSTESHPVGVERRRCRPGLGACRRASGGQCTTGARRVPDTDVR